jgi:hypothetical protein
VGVLANLPNIHRFFFRGPEYKVLQEQATVEIGKKIAFDGVSMVPHEVSGSEPIVYFDVVARGPVTSPTKHVSVGSPLYLDAGGNKYAIHVLALTGTSPKRLLLKIEKETR